MLTAEVYDGNRFGGIYRLCTWETQSLRLVGNIRLDTVWPSYPLYTHSGTAVDTEAGQVNPISGILNEVHEPHDERPQHHNEWCYSPAGSYRARIASETVIEIQQLRRPLAWYGIFWLPEFYLTALCAIGLTWSAYRDARDARSAL